MRLLQLVPLFPLELKLAIQNSMRLEDFEVTSDSILDLNLHVGVATKRVEEQDGVLVRREIKKGSDSRVKKGERKKIK